MTTSTSQQESIVDQPKGLKETTERDDRRRKLGLVVAIVGASIILPAVAVSIIFPEWRGIAALTALVAWFVWKSGRMIQRLHSGLQ